MTVVGVVQAAIRASCISNTQQQALRRWCHFGGAFFGLPWAPHDVVQLSATCREAGLGRIEDPQRLVHIDD